MMHIKKTCLLFIISASIAFPFSCNAARGAAHMKILEQNFSKIQKMKMHRIPVGLVLAEIEAFDGLVQTVLRDQAKPTHEKKERKPGKELARNERIGKLREWLAEVERIKKSLLDAKQEKPVKKTVKSPQASPKFEKSEPTCKQQTPSSMLVKTPGVTHPEEKPLLPSAPAPTSAPTESVNDLLFTQLSPEFNEYDKIMLLYYLSEVQISQKIDPRRVNRKIIDMIKTIDFDAVDPKKIESCTACVDDRIPQEMILQLAHDGNLNKNEKTVLIIYGALIRVLANTNTSKVEQAIKLFKDLSNGMDLSMAQECLDSMLEDKTYTDDEKTAIRRCLETGQDVIEPKAFSSWTWTTTTTSPAPSVLPSPQLNPLVSSVLQGSPKSPIGRAPTPPLQVIEIRDVFAEVPYCLRLFNRQIGIEQKAISGLPFLQEVTLAAPLDLPPINRTNIVNGFTDMYGVRVPCLLLGGNPISRGDLFHDFSSRVNEYLLQNAFIEGVCLKNKSKEDERAGLFDQAGNAIQFSIPGIITISEPAPIFGVFQYIVSPNGKRLIHRCFKPLKNCGNESNALKKVLFDVVDYAQKEAARDPQGLLFWSEQKVALVQFDLRKN